MPKRSSITPKDLNELASHVVRQATEKNPAAVALGKLGGVKGGKARAAALTPERRKEIAQKAAKTRWKNNRNEKKSKTVAPETD